MSVLIKGMKMPRHCGECGIEWCDRWKQLIIAGMSIAKTRPSDCPLIELPPHGDLIDRDALIVELMDRGVEGLQTDDWHEIQQTVADAPTIIPAEPPKEENNGV